MGRLPRLAVIFLIATIACLPLRAWSQDSAATPFKAEEIEQLVAPIALYPDALVAQILMASTYPLEIVSAARWSKANPNVKGKELEDAMQTQSWDPSVKSLTAFPQVLSMLNEKLDMTQKLGDAFLGQQKDVLDAVQRLRAKADAAGNLKSGKEQTVTTEQEAGQTIIKIVPADPQVVYVPTYNPTVIYGVWAYPAYPPYYWYPPGYVAGTAFWSFTAGVIVGSALWGGCHWGRGEVNININRYNNFNKTNIKTGDWQHKPEHRKGVQYRDQASQQKFGGGQRAGVDSREAFRGRAEQGRQDISRGAADNMKRDMGAGDRAGGRDVGAGNQAGSRDMGGDRQRDASAGRDRAGAADRGGGFDGIGQGGQTRAASNRGATSRASAGASRGGGGRAGGGRRR